MRLPVVSFKPSGTLLNVGGAAVPADRALVVFDILDDISGYELPLGSAGEAAIYTQHFHELTLAKNPSADAKLAELRFP